MKSMSEESKKHKAKIRQVMIEHLKSKGYPNMTSKEILAELKPMWVKLGNLGLLHPGWKYEDFVQIEQAEEHYANLRDALKEELANHFMNTRKKT